MGHVQNRLFTPIERFSIAFIHLFLAVHIGIKIRQYHVIVPFTEKRINNGAITIPISGRKESAPNVVKYPPHFIALPIGFPGVVAGRLSFRHLPGIQTEDEDIVIPHGVFDFDIGAVESPDGQRPVQGKLHVSRTGCFFSRR